MTFVSQTDRPLHRVSTKHIECLQRRATQLRHTEDISIRHSSGSVASDNDGNKTVKFKLGFALKRLNQHIFNGLCRGKAMVAYTKPQQRKKKESERLRGERDRIKFIDLGFERW